MSLNQLEVKRIGSKVFITIECGSIEDAERQEVLYKQGFAQAFQMMGSLGGMFVQPPPEEKVIEGTAVIVDEAEQRRRRTQG